MWHKDWYNISHVCNLHLLSGRYLWDAICQNQLRRTNERKHVSQEGGTILVMVIPGKGYFWLFDWKSQNWLFPEFSTDVTETVNTLPFAVYQSLKNVIRDVQNGSLSKLRGCVDHWNSLRLSLPVAERNKDLWCVKCMGKLEVWGKYLANWLILCFRISSWEICS